METILAVQHKLHEKFYNACREGKIDVVRHLLEKPSLAKYIDLLEDNLKGLGITCLNCDENLIDYLLNKPEIANSDFVNGIFSDAFGAACYHSNLKKMHFLYSKEKYRKYIDLSYNNTWCFRIAYTNTNKEVLQFLILEAKLSKDNPDVIAEMYSQKPRRESTVLFVRDLFAKQELIKQLNESLVEKEEKYNKPKPKI